MTTQNIETSNTQDNSIDLDVLLNKIKLDHRIRSLRPDTYSDEDRARNLLFIDRLSLMIDVYLQISNDPTADNETLIRRIREQRTASM